MLHNSAMPYPGLLMLMKLIALIIFVIVLPKNMNYKAIVY
jgi:hypothetical protein